MGYGHPDEGAGSGNLPEIGAKCVLLYPSDGSPPVVISYEMPLGYQEMYKGGLPQLDNGDQFLLSTGHGYVIVRASGIVELGSGPTCAIQCIPLDNLLRMYFGNLEMISTLGRVVWSGDKNTAQLLIGVATAKGGYDQVTLRVGCVKNGVHATSPNMADAEDINFELIIGENASTTIFGLHISGDGKYSTESGDAAFVIRGSYEITADDHITIKTLKSFNVEANEQIVTETKNVSMTYHTEFKITQDKLQMLKLKNGKVYIGDKPTEPAISYKKLVNILITLANHVDPSGSLAAEVPGIASPTVRLS